MTDSSTPGSEERTHSEPSEDEPLEPPSYHPPRQEEFDWRGWTLVGVIVVSFLVVPGAILFLPQAEWLIAAVGISWTQAYLVLPMIPALLLGATAIWAAVSSRKAN